MQISKAGISDSLARGRFKSGFTLLELLVVIFILSTILLVVFPRLSLYNRIALRSEARRTAALIRYLHESSSTKKIYYRLRFYPERGRLEVESSRDGIEFNGEGDSSFSQLTLMHGAHIRDIVIPTVGRVKDGSIAVIFNPASGAEPFDIHLRGDKMVFTVSYNPYSGRVKVLSGYL